MRKVSQLINPLISTTVALGCVLPALGSDSPFKDFMKYHDTLVHAQTLSELQPYTLDAHKAEMTSTDPAASKMELDLLRTTQDWQNVKLRSENKNGNTATVIIDCNARDILVLKGQTAQVRPNVAVLTMINEEGLWKAKNVAMHTPEEAANYGISDANSMQSDKAWALGAHQVTVPNKPLAGMLAGAPITLSSASISTVGGEPKIDLRMSDTPQWKNMMMFITLDKHPNLTGTYTESSVKQVQISWMTGSKSNAMFFDNMNPCGMTLNVLAKKDGNYPIYMVMRVPDGKHSQIKGYFYAKGLFGA